MIRNAFFILFASTFILALLLIISSIGYLMHLKFFYKIGRKEKIINFENDLASNEIIQKLQTIKFLKFAVLNNEILVRCRVVDKMFYIKPRAIINIKDRICSIYYDDTLKYYILLFLMIIVVVPFLALSVMDIWIFYIGYSIIALIVYSIIGSIIIYLFSKWKKTVINNFISIIMGIFNANLSS